MTSFPPSVLDANSPSRAPASAGTATSPGARTMRSLIACSWHRTGHGTGPTPSPASRRAPPVQLLHSPIPPLNRRFSRRGHSTFPPQIGSAELLRSRSIRRRDDQLPPSSLTQTPPRLQAAVPRRFSSCIHRSPRSTGGPSHRGDSTFPPQIGFANLLRSRSTVRGAASFPPSSLTQTPPPAIHRAPPEQLATRPADRELHRGPATEATAPSSMRAVVPRRCSSGSACPRPPPRRPELHRRLSHRRDGNFPPADCSLTLRKLLPALAFTPIAPPEELRLGPPPSHPPRPPEPPWRESDP